MSELETYRRRTREAAEALNALPLLGPGEPGPPDEQTGERWDRANVLGHVAEMLPFWTSQMRGVIGGGTQVGRGESGQERRRDGIESGRLAGEEELRQRVGAGVEGLLLLLDEMREEDLDRRTRFLTPERRARGGPPRAARHPAGRPSGRARPTAQEPQINSLSLRRG